MSMHDFPGYQRTWPSGHDGYRGLPPCDSRIAGIGLSSTSHAAASGGIAMKRSPANPLPAMVESFFSGYLQRIRVASPHTVRAYRDTLKLFLTFLSEGQIGRASCRERV